MTIIKLNSLEKEWISTGLRLSCAKGLNEGMLLFAIHQMLELSHKILNNEVEIRIET